MKKIKTETLKKALERTRPGLANKEFIEQTTSFAFVNGNLITYNDEISISYPIPELEDMTGAVEGGLLYNFINKVKKEEIEIDFSDNELLLKAGNIKAGLTYTKEIKLPLEEIEKTKGFRKLPKNFVENIKLALPIASTDITRPALICVYCKDDNIEATDGHKLIQIKTKEKFPFEFLIPAYVINKVISLDLQGIAKTEGWIHFKTKNESIVSCRTVNDKFPDADMVLKRIDDFIPIELPANMQETIDRSRSIIKKEDSMEEGLDITLKKGQAIIEGKADAGWVKEKQRVNYKGNEIHFSITPTLLLSILREEDKNCFINKDETQLVFKKDNWVCLSMLRIKNDK